MKIYLHDEKTGGEILQICKGLNLDLLTPADVAARADKPIEYGFFLDEVDALVLEITQPNQTLNYIMAQAILASKPTLALYGKNQPPREVLRLIRSRKAPRPIKTFSYTDRDLTNAVTNFIKCYDAENVAHDEEPSIKFTLRLSPRAERFLVWLCQTQGITKADYIRLLLARAAKAEKKYKDDLRD